jgi:hypothetical protein
VPKAGVGFGVNLTKKANLNLSFQHEFERESKSVYMPETNTLLLGVKYSF